MQHINGDESIVDGVYAHEVRYWVPVNEPEGEDGSVTHLRLTVHKGSTVEEARESLSKAIYGICDGMTLDEFAKAFDFPELLDD